MILKRLSIGAIVFFAAVFLSAEEKPLSSPELIQALTQEVSGAAAFDYTVMLSQYDRIQASEGWHQAALRIQDHLKRGGYENAVIEGWPSNGSRYYYTYQTPIGWKAEEAELWMIEPEKKRLCSYSEIPLTLVKHSGPADVTAELVDVGTGVGEESYHRKDVTNKIVLATAYTGEVAREAVKKRGAEGVITWYPPEVRPGYPDMIRYTAIWPTWEEKDHIGFGFNVSKKQGWMLKKLLDQGERVVLKAHVRSKFIDSKIEILTASFPGNTFPEQEVLIVGHLCHPQPSANDNASGSGGMLEMALALQRMVKKGLVPPPKRTIRFLWVPEFYGTIPYIKAHLKRTRNTLAVINCDMIGEDLHLTGGTFNITCTPDSMPTFLNDVVVDFTRTADALNLTSVNGSDHPFAYKVLPYSGGSDHVIFNDGSLKVPAVMFGHGDRFHHTSLDTPDKVDPSELRRICWIALGSVYYIAQAGSTHMQKIARVVRENSIVRLNSDYHAALEGLYEEDKAEGIYDAYWHAANVLIQCEERESAAVMSSKVFSANEAAISHLQKHIQIIGDIAAVYKSDLDERYRQRCRETGSQVQALSLSSSVKEWTRIIPVRAPDFVCPLQTDYLVDKLGEACLERIHLRGNVPYEVLNFADGSRSIWDITLAVSAEFGRISGAHVLAYFQLLQEAGLISFKEDDHGR